MKKYDFQIVCFKKIVESAHMPELKKLKMYSWELKMVVPFSYGKVKEKDFLNKDQISSGEDKKKG